MSADWHPADIIVCPVISEKSMDYTEQGKYVFLVTPRATKAAIRRAVSEIYGVDVVKVNIVTLPRKPKHWGRYRFKTGKTRKAVVTLAEGQAIPQITEAM